MNILLLAIGAALVNNVILSQFLGLCPFLGVSKSVNTATGMGAAVVFVMTIASFVTSVVYYGILRRFGLEYLNTIVFILVIAALVQFVEMFLKKKVKSLYESLGVYLPEKDLSGHLQCTRHLPATDHDQLCRAWYRSLKCTERLRYT